MRRVLLLVLVPLGCNFNPGGVGSTSGSDMGTGSGSGTTADAGTAPATTSEPGTSTTATPGDSSASATTAADTTGAESSGGPPPPSASSCAEILAQEPNAASGPYQVVRMSDGATVDVYCEMELDGGGWTLVGRSVQGGNPQNSFGWRHSLGTVGDAGAPYSLDVASLGLEFTQILVTGRTGFATPGSNAYVIDVPAGFIDDFHDASYQPAGAHAVVGTCEPMPLPTMLMYVGYTDDDDHFYFRDLSGNFQTGLRADRFDLAYSNCEQGGNLHDRQGALFVR